MTSGEIDVLADVAARVEELVDSVDVALTMITPVPADLAGYSALPTEALIVIAGFLKTVEQLEEQTSRLFRTLLSAKAVDVNGMYARDIADRMEQLGVLEDAVRWTDIVKLRNRLVHDYPLGRAVRLARLHEAVAAVPFLRATARTALDHLDMEGHR